jgi:hypothetical protein
VTQTPSDGRDFAKTQFSAENEKTTGRAAFDKTGELNCKDPPKMQYFNERPQRETEIMAPTDGTVLSKKCSIASNSELTDFHHQIEPQIVLNTVKNCKSTYPSELLHTDC